MPLARVIAFIRLGRPLFLGGGFLLFALGALVAVGGGAALDRERYVLGQVAVTAFQLMTHYANDYFDFEADVANTTPTRWSGGSRVLVARAIPRHVALVAAIVLAAAGSGVAVVLALHAGSGPLTLPILLATLVLAWGYSGPPLRLHSTGFGELNTAVVVTGLVPLLGFYLQMTSLAGARVLFLAIAPLAALQVAMLLAIEFPDAAGDRAVGKRTLVVRLGGARSARLYATITALAFGSLPLLVALGLPPVVAAAAALPLPFAVWRIVRVGFAGDWANPERWESLTFWAVFLLMATSAGELGAFACRAWPALAR